MKKRNWTNRVVIITFISIFLLSNILIITNRSIIDQKIEIATANTQKQSFEIWTIEGEMAKVIEEVIPIYKEAYPNINFKFKVFKSNIYNELLLNASRTNSLPDVFFSWGGQRLEDLVKLNVVADVTETVNKKLNNEFCKGALEGYTFSNRIYGLPVFGWNNVLYCNTEIFKAHNLELPTTYDELLEVVKAFKSQGVTPLVMGGGESWMASLYFMEFVLDQGDMGQVEKLTRKSDYFESDVFQDAASRFKQLIDLRPWQPDFETMTSSEAVDDFVKGEGAMILLGSWSSVQIDSIIHSLVKGKVQAINFPRNNMTKVGIGGYADGFVLNKNASIEGGDVQKLFVDMIKQISDRSVEGKGLGIPVYKNQVFDETRYELLKQCNTLMTAENYHRAYDQILDYGFVERYNSGLQNLIKGYVSAEEFIQEVVKEQVDEEIVEEYDD